MMRTGAGEIVGELSQWHNGNVERESVFKKSLTFWLFGIAVVIANILDLISTYYISPNLECEANFVFRLVGGGLGDWYIVLLLKIGISLLGLAMLAAGIRKIPLLYPHSGNWSFAGFAGYIPFQRKAPMTWLIYRLPESYVMKLLSGYLISLTVIITGVAAALSNMLHLISGGLTMIVFHIVVALMVFVFAFALLWIDYLRSCGRIAQNEWATEHYLATESQHRFDDTWLDSAFKTGNILQVNDVGKNPRTWNKYIDMFIDWKISC
ncbi:hypothetical protein ACFL54_04320 [Planctomycetota bacterium]